MRPGGDLSLARLTELITRQRQEAEQLRATAAARSVVDLARGILMERLGCTAAEAQDQLTRLSREARLELTELAAQIAGQLPAPAAAGPVPEATDPAPGAVDHAPGAVDHAPGADPAGESTSLAWAGMEFAADGSQVATALLEEALGPAGAVAVALWLIAPDGGLELSGEAGFGPREASRWRRIPPGMSLAPQRAASTGTEFWWAAGPPDDDPVPLIGRWPGGGRAVLPLRSAGRTLGALEACWAEPVPSFPAALRRQLGVLAEVAARALGSAGPDGDLSPGYQSAWLFGLLDGLHESVLYAYALRDETGRVTDFRIDRVSEGFRDPAGRAGPGGPVPARGVPVRCAARRPARRRARGAGHGGTGAHVR